MVAKSGWPVIGHTHVNSGTTWSTSYSRSAWGFGTRWRSFDGALGIAGGQYSTGFAQTAPRSASTSDVGAPWIGRTGRGRRSIAAFTAPPGHVWSVGSAVAAAEPRFWVS